MNKIKELSSIAFNDSKILINKYAKVRTKSEIMANLKINLPIVLSLFLFMIFTQTSYHEGYLFSAILILLSATQIYDLKERVKSAPLCVKVYSLISSFGICFYALKTNFMLEQNNGFIYWSAMIIAISVSIISIFALTTVFLNWLFTTIKSLFLSLSKYEIISFSIISVLLIAFSAYSFLNSYLFWFPSSNEYDLLYTSDTASILNDNAYMSLLHSENDIRQPLYAVFAAPVLGAFYTLSIPFSFICPAFYALLMNTGQILMMMTANLMVIKMIEPGKVNSICLITVLSLTHTTLISTLMIEQYIVAYFYLILAIYYYITYNKSSILSIAAAAGTMLTSAVIFPVEAVKNNDLKKIFRNALSSLFKNILAFTFMTIAFCRLDVVFSFVNKVKFLMAFSSIESEKKLNSLNQFFSFAASCFIAPESAAEISTEGIQTKITWQLTSRSITDVNYIGIIILVLCLISAVVNRKNTITRIAALWSLFSMVLLGIVGWGAVENGMVLYSLYFCWAYFILIVQLVKWLSERIKCKSIIIIASTIISVLLTIINYYGIAKLLDFAFSEYPFSL